jgi:agmatine/peptidylarginine deiminase
MLPRAKRDYETYVNSLIINGTVWVPIYQQKTDAEALKVYKDLGFKVIAADSSLLSNEGAGSIHCITMTYPKTTSFNDVLAHFGAQNVVDSATLDSKVDLKVKELQIERQEHLKNLQDPDLNSYLDSLYRGWF